MTEPEWIAYEVILAIHEAQIAEHGGIAGVGDKGLLESALAGPRNLFAYTPNVTLTQLAASYAVKIAKNRSFVDGNKRTAWVACVVFLQLNGIRVTTSQLEVGWIVEEIASGQISEAELAAWLDIQYSEPCLVGLDSVSAF